MLLSPPLTPEDSACPRLDNNASAETTTRSWRHDLSKIPFKKRQYFCVPCNCHNRELRETSVSSDAKYSSSSPVLPSSLNSPPVTPPSTQQNALSNTAENSRTFYSLPLHDGYRTSTSQGQRTPPQPFAELNPGNGANKQIPPSPPLVQNYGRGTSYRFTVEPFGESAKSGQYNRHTRHGNERICPDYWAYDSNANGTKVCDANVVSYPASSRNIDDNLMFKSETSCRSADGESYVFSTNISAKFPVSTISHEKNAGSNQRYGSCKSTDERLTGDGSEAARYSYSGDERTYDKTSSTFCEVTTLQRYNVHQKYKYPSRRTSSPSQTDHYNSHANPAVEIVYDSSCANESLATRSFENDACNSPNSAYGTWARQGKLVAEKMNESRMPRGSVPKKSISPGGLCQESHEFFHGQTEEISSRFPQTEEKNTNSPTNFSTSSSTSNDVPMAREVPKELTNFLPPDFETDLPKPKHKGRKTKKFVYLMNGKPLNSKLGGRQFSSNLNPLMDSGTEKPEYQLNKSIDDNRQNSKLTTTVDSENSGKKPSRQQMCRLCANHHLERAVKGHKYVCEFRECTCVLCTVTRRRQHAVREQQKLTRRQEAKRLQRLENSDDDFE